MFFPTFPQFLSRRFSSSQRRNPKAKAAKVRLPWRLALERLEDRVTPTVTITSLNPPSATEGINTGTITVATVTDTNPSPNAIASISWGDGTTDTVSLVSKGSSTFVVRGSHTYPDEGTTTFSVSVTD